MAIVKTTGEAAAPASTEWELVNANSPGGIGMQIAVFRTDNYVGAKDVKLPWGFEPIAVVASTATNMKPKVAGAVTSKSVSATLTKKMVGNVWNGMYTLTVDGVTTTAKVTPTTYKDNKDTEDTSDDVTLKTVNDLTTPSYVTVIVFGAPIANF